MLPTFSYFGTLNAAPNHSIHKAVQARCISSADYALAVLRMSKFGARAALQALSELFLMNKFGMLAAIV